MRLKTGTASAIGVLVFLRKQSRVPLLATSVNAPFDLYARACPSFGKSSLPRRMDARLARSVAAALRLGFDFGCYEEA